MADPVPAPVPPPSDAPKETEVPHAFRTYASDVAQLTGKPLPVNVRNEPAPAPAPSPKPAPAPVPPPAQTESPKPEPVPAPAPVPEFPRYDPPPALIIPKAPSTDESREQVLARLRQRAATDPVIETPAPVPIAKAPSTDESREQVLARLKARASGDVAAPVPISPPAPIAVPATPPPAALSRVAAAAAAAPAPSPLHTYKSDFAGKSAQEGASRISVLAAEQDARRGAGATLPPQSKSKTFAYVAGALLIVAGIGSIYAAYQLATGRPVIPQELSIPSIIFADERSEIEGDGSGLRDAFVALTNEPLSEGKVRIAYRTFSTTTPEGILSVPEDGGTLIAALTLPAPGILLRNVEPESVPGIISIAGEARPFLILRVSSYERSFAGMLDWEPTMETGLADFFPAHPAPVVVEEPSASTTMPNVPLPQTSFSFSDGFVDEVVANRDVRVLRDSDGRVLMLYGYRDKRTLIIARSPDAFAELVARLAASASR